MHTESGHVFVLLDLVGRASTVKFSIRVILTILICVAALSFFSGCSEEIGFHWAFQSPTCIHCSSYHVPGAFAHIAGSDFLLNSDLTELGMRFTALGAMCFVAGVWLSRSSAPNVSFRRDVDRAHFWWFCLIGGWICVYGLTPLYDIPSVSAAVDKGAGVWMLGVMLGLRAALQHPRFEAGCRMARYAHGLPGSDALVRRLSELWICCHYLVCSALTISTRSYWRVVAGITIFTFLSLSIFVNYFQHRTDIRDQVWGGAPLEARINSVIDTGTGL